jgi:hypothetical protein
MVLHWLLSHVEQYDMTTMPLSLYRFTGMTHETAMLSATGRKLALEYYRSATKVEAGHAIRHFAMAERTTNIRTSQHCYNLGEVALANVRRLTRLADACH